jgi:hypothetical protein
VPTEPSRVERLVAEVDPDRITAKEALDLVYRLKKALVEGEAARQTVL